MTRPRLLYAKEQLEINLEIFLLNLWIKPKHSTSPKRACFRQFNTIAHFVVVVKRHPFSLV